MIYFCMLLGVAAFVGFSLRFNWWRIAREGVPVLMYHSIDNSAAEKEKLEVTLKDFEKQLKYLSSKGYKSITLRDLKQYVEGKKIFEYKPVVITFDDGYRNNIKNASPVLRKYGFSAVFFIASAYVGGKSLWDAAGEDDAKSMMDWGEIKTLVKDGFEIASHTVTHADLVKIDQDSLLKELTESKKILEDKLNIKINAVSYPYGHYNNEIVKAVKLAGYEMGIATLHGINRKGENPFVIKRVLIRGYDRWLDFLLNITRGRSHI
ncbi:MAG: polysaccharide deacetylase family protein [Candidatus Aureabacteria bacterium]|nr:polysaccharide deacetylase family protein [Candidatus Auribacterota bacterium]